MGFDKTSLPLLIKIAPLPPFILAIVFIVTGGKTSDKEQLVTTTLRPGNLKKD